MAEVTVASGREFVLAKDAFSKWVRFRKKRQATDDKILRQLARKNTLANLEKQSSQERIRHKRQLPVDILAREWLNLVSLSPESRIYLLENILPLVILGIEKLCTEVSKRGLEDCVELTSEFNPINYLGQYLMRNNPQYSNFAEASPYMRGLKQASNELREQVLRLEESKLAKLKASARKRREEREKEEARVKEVKANKMEAVRMVFRDWVIPEETTVELSQIQLALKAFKDTADIEVDITECVYTERQFVELVWDYYERVRENDSDMFDPLMEHLTEYGQGRKLLVMQKQYRSLLDKIFAKCDVDETGSLDRLRVLHLLECFYDNTEELEKSNMLNPRKWPVAEIVEDELEEEKEEEQRLSSILSRLSIEVDEEAQGDSERSGLDDSESNGKQSDLHKEATIPSEETKHQKNTSDSNKEASQVVGGGSVEEKVVKGGSEEEKVEGGSEEEKVAEGGSEEEKVAEGGSEEEKVEVGSEEEKVAEGGSEEEKVEGGSEEEKVAEGGSEEEKVAEGGSEEEKVAEGGSEEKKVKGGSEEEKVEGGSEEEKVAEGGSEEKKVEGGSEEEKVAEGGSEEEKVAEGGSEEEKVVEGGSEEKKVEGGSEEEKVAEGGSEEEKVAEGGSEEEKVVEGGSEEEKVAEGGSEEEKVAEGTEKISNMENEGAQPSLERRVSGSVRRMSPVPEETTEVVSEVALPLDEDSVQTMSAQQRELQSRAMSISKCRRLSGMSATPVHLTGPGQSWDHEYLSPSQFAQLVELFLGSSPSFMLMSKLANFIEANYKETSAERELRLRHLREQAEAQRRYRCINHLFDVWDNNKSGYLELDELQMVVKTWKDFTDEQALLHVQAVISTVTGSSRNTRLSRLHFYQYISELSASMTSPAAFDEFTDYLLSSMKWSFEEKRRKDQRAMWMEKIQLKGKTNFLNMDPALYSAVNVIQQDSKMFGEHAHISTCIGLMDPGNLDCLRFRAASEDCRDHVVGQKLYSYNKQVSFTAVTSGRPVYVPSIQKNGSVHFFKPKHINSSEVDGALFVAPITSPKGTVMGTLGVDTLGDDDNTEEGDLNIVTHQQHFYQGVALALGDIIHDLEVRRQFLTTAHVATDWMHRRCSHITEINVYFAEPIPPDEVSSRPGTSKMSVRFSGKMSRSTTPSAVTPTPIPVHLRRQLVLRHVIEKRGDNDTILHKNPQRMFFHEHLFKRYLFDGVENSEAVTAEAFGMKRLAYPVRDHTGCAVAIVDIASKKGLPMATEELRESMKVLKLLTMAFNQLSRGGEETSNNPRLATGRPHKISFVGNATVLFDQLMLSDLREKVEKLDTRVFAELRSYTDPPPHVHQVIKAVLMIFYPQHDLQQWSACKQFLTTGLVKLVVEFDPFTSKLSSTEDIKAVVESLDSKVVMRSSSPARHLYNWLVVSLSLMEHTAVMNQTHKQ